MDKFCPSCKQTLPMEKFGLRTASKDGKQTYCKACMSAHQKEVLRKIRAAHPRPKAPKLRSDRKRYYRKYNKARNQNRVVLLEIGALKILQPRKRQQNEG